MSDTEPAPPPTAPGVTDSTVAFSAYGLICQQGTPTLREAVYYRLCKLWQFTPREQFERALDRMVELGWIGENAGHVWSHDPGKWMPFGRDRDDVDYRHVERDAGWKDWMVRGPQGHVAMLEERINAAHAERVRPDRLG